MLNCIVMFYCCWFELKKYLFIIFFGGTLIILFFYEGAFLFYVSAFLLHIVKLQKLEYFSGMAGLLINGALLIHIADTAGHLPVFNLFESLMSASFILACMCIFFTGWDKIKVLPVRTFISSHDAVVMVWLVVLLLFGITLVFPKIPAASRYDYNYPYAVCFFLFRVLSLSMLLFSSALFFTSSLKKRVFIAGNKSSFSVYRKTFHQGRNLLLLGTVMFLVSEFSGMVWCQKGWADIWQWSDGHLQSVFIFFYLMLAFHIRKSKKNNSGIQSIVAGMGGVVMLVFMVIRGID